MHAIGDFSFSVLHTGECRVHGWSQEQVTWGHEQVRLELLSEEEEPAADSAGIETDRVGIIRASGLISWVPIVNPVCRE